MLFKASAFAAPVAAIAQDLPAPPAAAAAPRRVGPSVSFNSAPRLMSVMLVPRLVADFALELERLVVALDGLLRLPHRLLDLRDLARG